ncbi:MAG: pentapeptide repeat-containing protein [Symploca sp. SIO1C4]|uniref:Pentapeptide repeat-containing protein n=1 Tax=Symploca sp. SIO1C4 TaxID=2607765 RepID=A0A6B3N8G2_9CYAN|nr:pentapeptide repeat-containing protein [Symploca sp. SIO1C4]
MKASEVLRKYQQGERDFRRLSLRGQSFKGKNLEGADFSEADIRGANFTNAYLKSAKFCGAKAGLQQRWVIFLVIISWLLSALSGIFSIWLAWLAALILNNTYDTYLSASLLSLIVLGVFLVFTIFKDPYIGFGASGFTGAVAGAIIYSVAGNNGFIGAVAGASAATGAGASVIAVAVTGAGAGASVIAVAGVQAFIITGAVAVAVAVAVAKVGVKTVVAKVVAIKAIYFTVTVAVVVVVAIALLGAYIGWRGIAGDEKYAWVRPFAIAFAATGGTSFYNANLTDADFTAATLKGTDLRKANLTRTCWRDTKKLDRIRPGDSYLENTKVRELVISKDGENKKFDHLPNLKGINLQGANLVNADFTSSVLKDVTLQGANLTDAILTGASLIGTNLEDANLSRAKLVQTKLDQANFTGAILTGAYIEDWGITPATILNGVQCEYIYMHLPSKDDPDPCRKPDNKKEVFKDGEFADFIAPLVKTLDLYHTDGVDPRAVAIAFQDLIEKNPEAEIEIISMEKRGKNKDKFLIRAETVKDANHSELSQEYFDKYTYVKALSPEAVEQLLAEKDNQIRWFQGQISFAIKKPNIQAHSYHQQGDSNMNENSGINTGGGNYIHGNYTENTGRDRIGTVKGDIINAAQPKTNLAEAAAEIEQLLKQLENSYPTTTISEQMLVAAEVVKRIESNPNLKKRVVYALKEGGLAAFEKAIDNPIGAFVVGAIKGWQEVETE